jgi:hypothetical protein
MHGDQEDVPFASTGRAEAVLELAGYWRAFGASLHIPTLDDFALLLLGAIT